MSEKPRRRLTWSAVALAAALAAVVAFMIFVQRHPMALSTLLSRLFSDRGNGEDPEQARYEALMQSLEPAETGAVRRLDSTSLLEAFALYPFADTYRQQYVVRYTDGERETARYVSLLRVGKAYRIMQFAGEKIDPSALLWMAECDGDSLKVEDRLGNKHLYLLGEDFPLASVALQPDPDDFCALLLAYEQSPDTSPLSVCTAELSEGVEGRELTLRFTYRESGQTEEYRYLLDRSILAEAKSTRDGVVYYRLETVSYETADELEEEELALMEA